MSAICQINGSRQVRAALPTVASGVLDFSAVHPVANLLAKSIQAEELAREIESLTASRDSVYNDIEIVTAKVKKPVPPRFKRHDQVRKTAFKIYHSALKGVLAKAEAEVLRNLRSYKPSIVVQSTQKDGFASLGRSIALKGACTVKATTPAWANLSFDLIKFAGEFSSAMGQAAEQAFKVTSRGLLSELGVGEIETEEGLAKQFVSQRENKISGCPQNIYDQINYSLKEGVDNGETMDELAERVQSTFGEVEEGRAMMIAQTETQSVYGTAQSDAISRAGFATKRWVSMDDDIVRPSHQLAEADGDIPVGEEFSNGLMYPGDPDADAGEVCGCRCYLAAGLQEEDEE